MDVVIVSGFPEAVAHVRGPVPACDSVSHFKKKATRPDKRICLVCGVFVTALFVEAMIFE
jgi:hypothetical protein